MDLLLVVSVVDLFGVADFDRGADFLKKHGVAFVALDLGRIGGVEPRESRETELEQAVELRDAGVELLALERVFESENVGFVVLLIGQVA